MIFEKRDGGVEIKKGTSSSKASPYSVDGVGLLDAAEGGKGQRE